MELDKYQAQQKKCAFYPKLGTMQGLAYTALAMCGEAGEAANIIKKALREDRELTSAEKEALMLELGDVLYYLTASASELSISLTAVAWANTVKINKRRVELILRRKESQEEDH